MRYNCGVTINNERGTLIAETFRLRWSTRLPDNVYVELEYFVWLKTDEGETLRMFGGLADVRELYVGWYDRRWQEPPPPRNARRFSEARLGDHVIRQEIPSFQPAGHFDRAEARALFANEGDVELVLRDENGVALQRAALPRPLLAAVEQDLMEAAEQVRANAADEVNRCRLEEVEPIVVS